MTRKENPAPRGNAGNRANPKVGQGQIRASAVDWEVALPTVLARLLPALASLGRAFG